MIDPAELQNTYKKWALDELKEVGRRNFEMSKYLFSVSVGSFAIFSFFGEQVLLTNYFQLIGLAFLVGSVLISLVIAEPADFKITGEENLPQEHTNYSANRQALRYLWFACWFIGVALIILTAAGSSDGKLDEDVQTNPLIEITNG